MLEFLKFTLCQFILKLKSKFKMTCDIWTETETLYLIILRETVIHQMQQELHGFLVLNQSGLHLTNWVKYPNKLKFFMKLSFRRLSCQLKKGFFKGAYCSLPQHHQSSTLGSYRTLMRSLVENKFLSLLQLKKWLCQSSLQDFLSKCHGGFAAAQKGGQWLVATAV